MNIDLSYEEIKYIIEDITSRAPAGLRHKLETVLVEQEKIEKNLVEFLDLLVGVLKYSKEEWADRQCSPSIYFNALRDKYKKEVMAIENCIFQMNLPVRVER